MTDETMETRVAALERALIAMHERCSYLEQTNTKILSCMKLTAKALTGLQAQIEALTGPPKPAARKPGGLVQ